MSDLAIALSALLMLLAPCLLALAICIGDRRAASTAFQATMTQVQKAAFARVSTLRKAA